jgi:ribose transport system substrate-binding protein
VLAQKYPKIQIVAERNCNPDRTAALRMMEDLLVTFPDLKGVFTVTDILALGASDAIVRAHRIEQIEITTAGFSQDSIDAMKRGWIDLNVDESPLLTGRVALNTAIDVLNGDTVHHTILVPNPVMSADQASEVEAKQHWAPSNWKLH